VGGFGKAFFVFLDLGLGLGLWWVLLVKVGEIWYYLKVLSLKRRCENRSRK